MVHRAFSVFLFTPDGKLLLQQRAATKVTFAEIWANTCCSHPLDVDSERCMAGAAGVVSAARRKLQQELGIAPEAVPEESFTWLTRVHYVGASGSSGGAAAASSAEAGAATAAASAAASQEPLWGEHEIDWILVCAPPEAPAVSPNPNEVQAVRAFTQQELREWLGSGSGSGSGSSSSGSGSSSNSSNSSSSSSGKALVTPWFEVMEKSGLLYKWWDAVLGKGGLQGVLDRGTIHRQQDLEAVAQGLALGAVPEPQALAACREATLAMGVHGPKSF
jgi:isopentenyl-diphosphate delta-isomerase type 1